MSKTVPFYIDTKENAIVELVKLIDPHAIPGGVDVGPLVPAPLFYNGQGKPQVGAILGTGQGGGSLMSQPANLSIGGTQIATLATMTCEHYGSWQIGTVAAGMTVTIQNVPTGMTIGLASVTVDDLAASSPEITAVEDFDGFTIDGTDLIIEMPKLGANDLLLIYAS